MLKVKVITIGKCKEDWLKVALAEYEKRLSGTLQISWILTQNDEKLEQLLKMEDSFIALAPNGIRLDSTIFSSLLLSFFEKNKSKATFAIGGPKGLSPSIVSKAKATWSLSPLTFTHQLTRLILIEQIYRAIEIAKNSAYHK